MRILSLLLVLVMLLSFAACGTDPVDPVDSGDGTDETTPAETTPAETTEDPLNDHLPEITFDGEEIRIWVDGQYDYYDLGEDEFIEGDVIHEAVIARNKTVEDRFDVTFYWDREPARLWRDSALLRQSILGGDEYDIVEGVTSYSCPLTFQGCYIDLAENEYFDFEKPWWQKSILDSLWTGDRIYCVSGFFDFASVTRSHIYYFNAEMAEDYNLGNLYDLVESGDWTWDKLIELSEIVADDVNQDGVYDNQDRYGTAGRYDHWTFQPSTAGYQWAKTNDDGSMEMTGLTDQLLAIHESVYPHITTSNLHWSTYTWGVHGRFDKNLEDEMLHMFADGQILFILYTMDILEGDILRDFGAYGLLPSPKYTEDQENYGTSTTAFISAIPVTTGDYDCTSIILEALQAESYKQLRSDYYDTCLSYKYVNDSQAKEMVDLMFSNLTSEFTYNYGGFGGEIGALPMACARQANMASYIQSVQESCNTTLKQLVEKVNTFPDYIPG